VAASPSRCREMQAQTGASVATVSASPSRCREMQAQTGASVATVAASPSCGRNRVFSSVQHIAGITSSGTTVTDTEGVVNHYDAAVSMCGPVLGVVSHYRVDSLEGSDLLSDSDSDG